MFIPDTLSRRAALPDTTTEIPSNKLDARTLYNYQLSYERKPIENQTETAKDPTLQKLKEYITSEWPKPHHVHHLAKPSFNIRDELDITVNLILKGDRIIVPRTIPNEMLKLLHLEHPGISKVKSRARSTLYWPGMNGQLIELTQTF